MRKPPTWSRDYLQILVGPLEQEKAVTTSTIEQQIQEARLPKHDKEVVQ